MNLRTVLMVSSTLGIVGGTLVCLFLLRMVREPEQEARLTVLQKLDDQPLPTPRTLGEALLRLDKVLDEDDRTFLLGQPDERTATGIVHHSLGRWIRNEWGLWRSSELYGHLQHMGLHHPDDMSGVILTSYYRWQRGEPLQVAEQIAYYVEWWERQELRAREDEAVRSIRSRMRANTPIITFVPDDAGATE